MPHRIPFMTTVLILAAAGSLPAQAITVQEPVFGSFGIGTTVSVPDRGGAFLGGVSRAASARNTFGPFRSGTNTGISRQAGGLTANVHILDMRELDQAVLSSARPDAGPRLSGPAEHAWQTLARRESGVGPTEAVPTVSEAGQRVSALDQAERYERLAEDAERRGKSTVARLHWQMAAKHGSAVAAERMRHLNGTAARRVVSGN